MLRHPDPFSLSTGRHDPLHDPVMQFVIGAVFLLDLMLAARRGRTQSAVEPA